MIELQHENQKVLINRIGAVVMTYEIDGKAILYPRQQMDNSYRGGSHVCLPNFGPDDWTDQPQHGYGRVVEWKVVKQSESAVVLEHIQTRGMFRGLMSRLKYCLSKDGFTMELRLETASTGTLDVAPAFHPYFFLPKGVDTIEINDMQFEISRTKGTEWVNASDQVNFRLGDREIRIKVDNLSTVAIWSGHASRYVCVEPTYAGNAHTQHGNGARQLGAGQQTMHSLAIQPQLHTL